MAFTEGLKILADRRSTAAAIITTGRTVTLKCLHCGAKVTVEGRDVAEDRLRSHVRDTCPATKVA